jgi:hypothetical protein
LHAWTTENWRIRRCLIFRRWTVQYTNRSINIYVCWC